MIVFYYLSHSRLLQHKWVTNPLFQSSLATAIQRINFVLYLIRWFCFYKYKFHFDITPAIINESNGELWTGGKIAWIFNVRTLMLFSNRSEPFQIRLYVCGWMSEKNTARPIMIQVNVNRLEVQVKRVELGDQTKYHTTSWDRREHGENKMNEWINVSSYCVFSWAFCVRAYGYNIYLDI